MFLNNAYPTWLLPNATDDYHYAHGSTAGTFTRASGATRINHRGYLEEVASNVRRYDYDPALAYNIAVNPWSDGGTIGTSAGPTEWGFIGGGLSAVMSAKTSNPDGTTTVEYTVSGTSNGNPQNLFFTEANQLPIANEAAVGDSFCLDVGFELVSIMGATSRVWLNSQSIAGNTVNSNAIMTPTIAAGTPYQRYRIAGALTNVGTAGAIGTVRLENMTNGTAVAAVFRVTFPVLVRGTTYLTDTVPLATLAARINGVPQYGLMGTLVETFDSTNTVTNPRCEGTVVGSPGTNPPPWICTVAPVSLTRTMVGTGVEAGIPYVDFRWSGTPSANWTLSIDPQGRVEIPAVAGETWAASQFVKLVGGTATNLSNPKIGISERQTADGGNTALINDFLVVPALLTATGTLVQCRYTHTRTLTNANTNRVTSSAFRVDVTSGMPIDFTVRVGAPQLEKQPFSTSVVLPAVGTPTASTRARDDQTLPHGFSLAEGTVMLELGYPRNGSTTSPGTVFAMGISGSGTPAANNRIVLYGTNSPNFVIADSSGTQAIFSVGSLVDTMKKVALAWRTDDAQACVDGVLSEVDTSITPPTSPASTFRIGGSNISATGGAGIWIKRIRRWPVRLTPEQLQQITTTS